MKHFRDMRRGALVQWAPPSQKKSFSCRSTPHDYIGWKLSCLKWYNQRREREDDRKLISFSSDIVLTILMYSSCRFILSTREVCVLLLKLQMHPCLVYLRTPMWPWHIGLLTAARFQYIWNPFVLKALPHVWKTSVDRNTARNPLPWQQLHLLMCYSTRETHPHMIWSQYQRNEPLLQLMTLLRGRQDLDLFHKGGIIA